MKAILKSIRPQHTCNILNGNKTLEISGTAPKEWKDYLNGSANKKPEPVDVYIYCTKENDLFKSYIRMGYYTTRSTADDLEYNGNGKVVAKFTLNKVEKIIYRETKEKNNFSFGTETLQPDELEQMSCLNIQELCKYIGKGTKWQHGDYGYAWHIDELEIFDKPKEISEFKHYKKFSEIDYMLSIPRKETCERLVPLTKAFQSWGYIEIE